MKLFEISNKKAAILFRYFHYEKDMEKLFTEMNVAASKASHLPDDFIPDGACVPCEELEAAYNREGGKYTIPFFGGNWQGTDPRAKPGEPVPLYLWKHWDPTKLQQLRAVWNRLNALITAYCQEGRKF